MYVHALALLVLIQGHSGSNTNRLLFHFDSHIDDTAISACLSQCYDFANSLKIKLLDKIAISNDDKAKLASFNSSIKSFLQTNMLFRHKSLKGIFLATAREEYDFVKSNPESYKDGVNEIAVYSFTKPNFYSKLHANTQDIHRSIALGPVRCMDLIYMSNNQTQDVTKQIATIIQKAKGYEAKYPESKMSTILSMLSYFFDIADSGGACAYHERLHKEYLSFDKIIYLNMSNIEFLYFMENINTFKDKKTVVFCKFTDKQMFAKFRNYMQANFKSQCIDIDSSAVSKIDKAMILMCNGLEINCSNGKVSSVVPLPYIYNYESFVKKP